MCKTCAERAGLAKQRSFVRASLSNFDLNGHPLSQSLRCILHVAAEGSGIPIFLKLPTCYVRNTYAEMNIISFADILDEVLLRITNE